MGQGWASLQPAVPAAARHPVSAPGSLTHVVPPPHAAAPATLQLDLAGAEADVRAALRSRASAALPAERDTAGGLKRTVLRCLLERGLSQRPDGGYELKPVLSAQLGEAVLRALLLAPRQQQELYKQPGHSLRALLASLQAAGIAEVALMGTAKCVAVRAEWLQSAAAQPASGGSAAEFDLGFLPAGIVKIQYPLIMHLTTAARQAIPGAEVGDACMLLMILAF